ncbi:helix-turn-helix domain-containing protein [Streptomyces sp. NPDC052043]|uniref:helix-turn-helix domain-containing protein n=1 Tax=Streptomyces sp. NPDC052043 TaxID=3365684 RepID=UPI0037D2D000
MHYDLNRLGTQEFEHLAQALVQRELGLGLSALVDGKDAGREASVTGPVTDSRQNQVWDGYGVVKAMFCQHPEGVNSDTEWLERNVRAEFESWLKPESKLGRLPEYVLFTTNVALSPVPDGGITRMDKLIRSYAQKVGLKGWAVWHHDEMCRLLDVHDSVRRSYTAFITHGTVLSRGSVLPESPDQLTALLAAQQPEAILGTPESQWVDFKSVGPKGPYDLSTEKGKFELAKDVAAFANASGGLLVCGFRAKRRPTQLHEGP